MSKNNLIIKEDISKKIHTFRNTKVMLDSDLAELYGINVSALNQAVKRNKDRFPKDFMFQLTSREFELLIELKGGNISNNDNCLKQICL